MRGKRFQLARARVKDLKFLDIGCGLNPHSHLINMDYLWHPEVDVCWDVTRGLPFADASLNGIFSEHCLEHFHINTAIAIMKECRRVLKPAGVLRIVVPDAEMYLRTYCEQSDGDAMHRFPFQDQETIFGRHVPMLSVNRIFYQDRESLFGHCCMYDFELLKTVLTNIGFNSVEKCSFSKGACSELLLDQQHRACESLYVEAFV